MRASRALLLVAAGAVVVSGLAACTSSGSDASGGPVPGGEDGTALESAATTLAGALASGDFGEVGVSAGEPQAVSDEYAATVEGLGDLTPSVTLVGVSEPTGDPATATATYAWTWPVGPDGWSYQSEATFTQSDDEWLVDWDVATIEPSLSPSVTLDLVGLGARRGDILG